MDGRMSLLTLYFAEVESGLEAGRVIDVVGVECNTEEAGV